MVRRGLAQGLLLAILVMGLLPGTASAQSAIITINILAGTVSNETYEFGETVFIQATFNARASVTGSPRIRLTIGDETHYAEFSESGGNLIFFSYTVQADDRDTNGISIPANPIELNGGTIKSASLGTDLNLSYAGLSDQSGHKVDGSKGEGLIYSSEPSTLAVGTTITPLTATPVNFAAGSTFTYAVTTGTLPPGLTLNTSTGAITGAPTTVSASTVTVTITVTAGTGMDPPTATRDIVFPAVSGALVFDPAALMVNEGSSGTYRVKLASQPSAGVTVAVTGAVGEVTVNPTSLTFTSTTWNSAQTVTVTAGQDTDASDDAATLVHTATGGDYAGVTGSVAVMVDDDDIPNTAPSITDITDKTATFGTNLLVDVDATDADAGNTLEYKAASGDATVATVTPTTLSAHDANSQVTVTPVGEGTATITVTVNDGTVDATDTFVVTVNKAVLAKPVVTVTAQDGQLTASWADVTNAASYEVQYKESDDTTWVDSSDDTSPAEITGLGNGQEHDVRVRAKAASASKTYADSEWSDVAKGTPVEADVAPSFGSETVAAQTWTVGTDVDVTLPAATGGNGTVSYALTPALPNGMSLDATTRKVRGTPTAVASAATYTWRASDSDSNTANTDTAALTFSVTVGKGTLAKPTGLALKTDSKTRTGFTVTWDAVPNAAGYTATAVQGSNSFTGAVSVPSSGPEAAFSGLTANTTYTVTVTATGDANYVMSEASDEINVTTVANQVPTVGTAIPDQTATVDTVFEYSFPAGTFSDADSDNLTYTATRSDDSMLPTWLTFTASERKLAGTPQSGDTGTLMVKVTASDGMGGSVSDTFDIVVSAAAVPSLTYPALPTTLRAGVQFAALTPASPANFAAGSTFTYAVTAGDLPSGLEINANTGAISGTPDTPKNTRTSVTVTVTGTTGTGMSMQTETATATLDFPRIFRFRLPVPTVTLSVGSGQLTASWGGIANADTYALQWKASSVTSWTAATGVTTVDPATPGTVISGLTNGATYDVRVRSKAASDSTTHIDGDWSSPVQGAPMADPTFSVSGPTTVAEDAGTATFTVTLSAQPAASVTVDYATADGTATAGSDYTAASGTLTFTTGNWDTAQTVNVTITDDAVDDDDETFTFTLSNAGTGAVLSSTASSQSTTITDDDTLGLTYTAPTTLTVDTPITALTATAAGFGSVTVTYSVTAGTLPAGLDINTGSGAISGTPTAASTSTTTVTVTATAGSGMDTQTATASITFPAVNKATLAKPTNLAVKANSNTRTGFTVTWDAVPNAAGYTATATPSGGSAVTGTVSVPSSGPEAAFSGLTANTTYTVTVTATGDANYSASEASDGFDVTTLANQVPTVGTVIPDQTATVDTAFEYSFPAGTFSDADSDSLTYTAQQTDGTTDSALPTWLTFTASERKLAGTPQSGDTGTLMVKVTASDGMGGSVSDTFDIVVSVADTAPAFASSETIAAQTWTVGTEVDVTLPAATGGNGTISYALTPALPNGVTLDATTRKVSGTPTAVASAATYTWRASDSDSNTADADTAALTFEVTVGKGTLAKPTNLAVKTDSKTRTGFTVTWDAVEEAAGYTATATPGGGTAVNGTVSVPSSGPEAAFTGLTANTTYTVAVTATGDANYLASEASDGFDVTTVANSVPTVGTVIPDQTATVDTAFEYSFPTGTFSDADSDSLTYTATRSDDSALPTWLSFTASERKLAGTPQSGDTGTLMVKVTASDGMGGSVSDTFDIVVSAADTAPAFASSTTIADKTFTVDTEITAFTLPEATGGNGTISYALTPDLPTGLSVDTSTREVSGTPTAAVAEATYTWRASDSDSNTADADTAALTFQVTVVDAVPIITPTQVSNLQVSAGDGSLEVSWTAASVTPNGYSVRWRERGPGNMLTPVNTVTGTSFTIPDLINGQEYVVRVETRNAADDGVQGGTVVTATGTPVGDESVVTPTQVSNLLVSAGDGSLDVSWTAASVAPNGYSVRWREKGPGNTLTPVNRVTGTSFTIPDLTNDQEYVVRIETRNAADDGVQGGTVVTATGTPVEDEVAPPPPPPTPTPPAVDERVLPTVSIEDASAMEGDDLEFRVTLSEAVRYRVKVYWATRPGTATANRDYKSAAGAVVFRPGVTERRVRVRTMEDSHNDPDETMQVRLSSPRGVLIEDGIATGMINNWDALPVAWLARFGRAVTEQALEGIEQRLTAPREAGTRGTLAGIMLAGLTTSNFTHTGAMDESGGSLAFWGRGARADFRGLDGVVHLDGQTETVTLGADYARDEWLTGVMLTSSRGTGGYQGVASGEVEVSLNAAIPYGSYRFSERLDVWGAVGRGTGALTLTPEGEGSIEADLDWSMVSAGLRGGLFGAAGHGPAMTLVSDVFWSRTGSGRVEAGEEYSSLASSEADTSRLRLGLEGSWAVTLGNVGAVTPKLEAGVRHDDGDAEQGFGVEVGGGLVWTLPALGVTLDVSGRTLVTHDDAGQQAHGFSAALNFDPSAASTRGFTLNLRQDIGGPSSGGVQALFASELPGVGSTGMGGGSTGSSAGTRWILETAYGLAACDDRFTLSPSFGLAASDTSVDFHLGWQLMPELSEDALDLSLTFKVTRRELLDVGTVNSIDSIGTLEQGPEHGVHMEVSARW